jgi:predicted transcriptional regulator
LNDDVEEELVQTDFDILRELLKADENPECNGLTQDDLVQETGRSRSHLSERLNFLQGKDLVDWSIPWGSPKRHYWLIDPDRFDPFQDSLLSLELLD